MGMNYTLFGTGLSERVPLWGTDSLQPYENYRACLGQLLRGMWRPAHSHRPGQGEGRGGMLAENRNKCVMAYHSSLH